MKARFLRALFGGLVLTSLAAGAPEMEPGFEPIGILPVAVSWVTVEVDENVEPNDPRIPRVVSLRLKWGIEPSYAMSYSSWSINWGDGSYTKDSVPPQDTFVTYSHVYGSQGAKYIRVELLPDGYPLVQFIGGWGRTLVGRPVPRFPGVHLSPTRGAWPLAVTATLDEPALGDMHLRCLERENAPKFYFWRGQTRAWATFDIPGEYTYRWSEVAWGSEEVFALPQDETFEIVVESEALAQPRLLSLDHLSGLCSPWDEWNARQTPDGRSIYFLSERDGAPRLYMAEAFSEADPFGAPRELGALDAAMVPISFELAEDGSHLICFANTRWAAPSLVRIDLGGDGRAVSTRPVLFAGSEPRLDPFQGYDWSGPGLFAHRSDLIGNGEIYVHPGADAFNGVAYRRISESPLIYVRDEGTAFRLDELPRLCSSDGRIRVWAAYEPDCTYDRQWPVYATAEGITGTSIYSSRNVAVEKHRHLWDVLFEDVPTCGTGKSEPVYLDQLSGDGRWLTFSANRSDSLGGLDLYRAELFSSSVENRTEGE